MLASGSSGNSMLVEHDGFAFIIDAGLSARQIRLRIEDAGMAGLVPRALVLTHEHVDHTRGARVTARRLGIPVICSPGTARRCPGLAGLPGPILLSPGCAMDLGPFTLSSFLLPHDAEEPSGYVIEWEGGRLGVATDLGCWSHLVADSLSGCTALVLEFNHDEEMLWSGSYPWPLKHRIASSNGHLSNSSAAQLLERITHPGLGLVVLAHLSRENNRPPVALEAARLARGFGGEFMVADPDRALAASGI